MKKALVITGSIFLLALAVVALVLFSHEQSKTAPGLYSYPPCTGHNPALFFETPEDYVSWIENPNLGIDERTDHCECIDTHHTIPSGMTIRRDYRYSVRSDWHRMFVVDRMYPLLHLQNNASSNGNPRKYGVLSGSDMCWIFLDEDGNRYSLCIRTDGKAPYTTADTSTSPPTTIRPISQEGDPYSIAPDPENYTVRELEEETYYISKPWPNDPNRFTISWFEGNYVASLSVTPKQPFVYDADTMDIGRYLSYFQIEFVDLPPLQEKTSFPWVWIIAGGLCLGASIGTFFVVRKRRNSKKPS